MADFDPFASGAAIELQGVTSEFDPFASGAAEEQAPDWNQLFSGVENAQTHMTLRQRKAFESVATITDDTKEAKSAAINQAYVQSHLPDWPSDSIQRDWPAVREAFAKRRFGMDGQVSDSQLYDRIRQHEEDKKVHLRKEYQEADVFGKMKLLGRLFAAHTDEATSENWHYAKDGWDKANTPFVPLPAAPQMPDLPALGAGNPAISAGIYNAFRPVLEGIETPLGVATIPLTASLKAASGTVPLAKSALVGITGLFTGLMAKSTYDTAKVAPAVMSDPDATLQQKIEAVGTPVVVGALTLLGALGTVYEIKGPAASEALNAKLKGATPEEAASILNSEATIAKTPAEATALKAAATEFEAITPKAIEAATKADEVAAKADSAKTANGEPASKPTEANKEATAAKTPEEIQKAANAADSAAIGIKNAAIDQQLKEMGLPAATHGEKLTFEAAREDAAAKMKADPFAGAKLVESLKQEMRPLSGKEDMLLLHEQNRLRIERDAAEKAIIDAQAAGDEVALAEAKARAIKASDDYQATAEMATQAGTENAQGLALRRAMMKEDYSLAAMEQRRRAANDGNPLTTEQAAEVKQLHEQLAAKQKELEEFMAAQPVRQPRRAPPPNKITEYLSKQADEARARIKARMAEGRLNSGLDPVDIADHAIIGADYLARGVTKFAEWSTEMVKEFGEAITPHLKAIFEQAQQQKKDASKLASYKTRTTHEIEKLKGKLDANDLTQTERKPLHLDPEANRLQAEIEVLKMEFQNRLARDRYLKSSALNKVKENLLNTYDTARLLMTTGEFSFILRQGKTTVLSHPVLSAKALPNAFRALMEDPAGAHALNLEVLNHPDAPAARAAKLYLMDEGAKLSKQEELLMGKWAGKIPLIGRFNQAATVFLNRIRFDLWNQMRKAGSLDAAGEKQLAMFVNEATGRGGLGSLEVAAVPLSRLMFSPRYFASRLQLVAGHSLWGGDMTTRRIIATEYAKTLVGLGMYYTALEMYLSAGNDDVEIGTNPTSSDFGKIKIGNTRLDPLAGVAQVVVFAARTATGEKTSVKGNTVPIRGDNLPYGGQKWSDVAATFARSKLHPVPGSIINLFDGTDLAGNKADLSNQAANMGAPVTYMDIYQALEEQDLPTGVSLSLLAVLGEGLQTYDPNKRAATRK